MLFLVQDGQSCAACRSMSVSRGRQFSDRVMLEMFANANPNIAQTHWKVAKKSVKMPPTVTPAGIV